MFSWLVLLKERKLFFLITVFLSILLFSRWSQLKKIVDNSLDKAYVENFLKRVMIKEGALYTLVGLKPMTGFELVFSDTKEQKLTRQNERELWKSWQKYQENQGGIQFLFAEDEDWGKGFLINVLEVMFVLDRHFQDFAEITRHSFDPKEAVYWIGDASTPFWKEVKKSKYLLGLLFGDEENAWNFQLIHKESNSTDLGKRKISELAIEDFNIQNCQIKGEQEESDEAIRKRILELYNDQDFTELTTNFLKGIPLKCPKREYSKSSKKLIEETMWYRTSFISPYGSSEKKKGKR